MSGRSAFRASLCLAAVLCLATGPLAAETGAVTGATVHTLGPQGSLEGATVVIADGRIAAVGLDVEVPEGARILDAAGKVVTPGLFDSASRIGAVEVGAEDPTDDAASEDEAYSAALDIGTAVNPRSTLIAINRVEGLTRAQLAPRHQKSLFQGRGGVLVLSGPEGFEPPEPTALFVALGEAGAERAGGSRAAAWLRLSEALQDARGLAADRQAFERAWRRPDSLGRLDLEALAPVARSEMTAALRVERASDIEAALRFAARQGLKLVILGGAEAWMVAPKLAEADVPVVLDPLENLPGSFESLGATLENAARLHAAGVRIAFTSGSSHNGRNLKQAAGNAVAYGLPWEEGLRAITATPAEIWGVGESCGTLEVGKEADLVVWDADPLEVTTFADAVFIRGREIPMDSRQIRLRERYRDLGGPLPPAYTKPAAPAP